MPAIAMTIRPTPQPTTRVVYADDATNHTIGRPAPIPPPSLRTLAVEAGDAWVNAVRHQAHAQIEVDRTESRFQAAINALHADGLSDAAEVHFRAHMMARDAIAGREAGR